jgi:hypothetical protein
MKEIENRKRKRRKEEKNRKGLGEAFRPSASFGHTPTNSILNRYLFSLSLNNKWGPAIIPLPQPLIPPETHPRSNSLPLLIPDDLLPDSSLAHAYK